MESAYTFVPFKDIEGKTVKRVCHKDDHALVVFEDDTYAYLVASRDWDEIVLEDGNDPPLSRCPDDNLVDLGFYTEGQILDYRNGIKEKARDNQKAYELKMYNYYKEKLGIKE